MLIYPLKMVIFQLIYPLKMVMFYSYLAVYQRVTILMTKQDVVALLFCPVKILGWNHPHFDSGYGKLTQRKRNAYFPSVILVYQRVNPQKEKKHIFQASGLDFPIKTSWLVVEPHPFAKYEFVSWDYDSQLNG